VTGKSDTLFKNPFFWLFCAALFGIQCGTVEKPSVEAFFDENTFNTKTDTWRVLAFENRTLVFGRLGEGVKSSGRRHARRLVQTEIVSTIRMPIEPSTGRRIVLRLHYDDTVQGSVKVRFLNQGILVREERPKKNDRIISLRIGFPKETRTDAIEIIHRMKPGSILPLKAVACGDVPVNAGEQSLRALTSLLDWLYISGYDARGGLPNSSVIPISMDKCTRHGILMFPSDQFATSLPDMDRGDRLRAWCMAIPSTYSKDRQVDIEVRAGGQWLRLERVAYENVNQWNSIEVRVPDSSGVVDSLRFKNVSEDGVIIMAEPHILRNTDKKETLNMILIDLDTARADRFGAYGYTERPTTARLDSFLHEKGFAVFQNAYAPSPWTLASTAKFLASRYVHEEMKNSSSKITEDVPLLAEVLRSNGYYCIGYTGGVVLRTPGFERGFHEYYWSQRSGKVEDSFPQAMSWLKNAIDPFFLFLHTYESHGPYIRPVFCGDLPQGRIIDPTLRRGTGLEKDAEITSAESLYIEALYDGGIKTACDAVTDLFELMESKDLWNNTVIVILSDHGEEFWEHFDVFQEHGHSLYGEILNVPFMIYYPALGSYTDIEEPVSLVDLVPTVAGLLDISLAENTDGQDLVPLIQGKDFQRRIPILANLSNNRPWEVRCIIDGGYKYLDASRKPNTGNIPIRHGIDYLPGVELYSLSTDPNELYNIAESNPDLVTSLIDSMTGAYDRLNPFMKSDNQNTQGGMGDALQQQLEALGYVTDDD